MDHDEFKEILRKHQLWLNDDPDPDSKRAELSHQAIRGINLEKVNLSKAYFYNVDFSNLDLHGANLSGATLLYSSFSGALLGGANLEGALCNGVNFTTANLYDTNLSRAHLSGANFAGSFGVRYAQVAFDGHGECGRQLSIVNDVYYCGCFQGSEAELRQYINNGPKRLKASRRAALNAVKKLYSFQPNW